MLSRSQLSGACQVSLFDFLLRNRDEVLALVAEHFFLVLVSTALAVSIGVPLGILLTRKPALSKPVLGFANIMQTVPSLALFGFLIPLNIYLFETKILGGIGPRTAIVALVLYSLLPIIRNTFTGISGVDPAIREAGKGMGMTDRQLLLQVELPLALGVIIAGVRVATVICVGTATIAAAIDAGGLGRYIFRGLRANDNILILAGAVPAALIALAADLLLGYAERVIQFGGVVKARAVKLLWGGALIAALFLVTAYFFTASSSAPVRVGAKDFTEQLLLGEIIAQAIEEKTGAQVMRRFDLGGNLAHEALSAGEIDVYVEYTGTGLLSILKGEPLKDPDKVYLYVKAEYAKRFNLEWTAPLGFDNTFAILVRREDAQKFNLKTISDVARVASQWRAGFGQDFMSRPDGYPGFSKSYGLRFAEVREMDLSLTYRALAEGQVDLIAGNSTDGLISRYGLYQLQDDRHYFPPYDAVPVARRSLLVQKPAVREALQQLGGVLSVDAMRGLNFAVDGEKRQPREVAREFLRQQGIVP
jgi:osmoprotectant transport system permease protein